MLLIAILLRAGCWKVNLTSVVAVVDCLIREDFLMLILNDVSSSSKLGNIFIPTAFPLFEFPQSMSIIR